MKSNEEQRFTKNSLGIFVGGGGGAGGGGGGGGGGIVVGQLFTITLNYED